MSKTAGVRPAALFVLPCLLALTACGGGSDEIADRVEREISPQHTTDPAERRAVAESLAEDARALGRDAEAAAKADAAIARQAEEKYGTPDQIIAAECAHLRLELETLQKMTGQTTSSSEAAELQSAIQQRKDRIAQLCR